MLTIITSENKAQWNEIIQSMNNFDFYHLDEYHQLDKSGVPLLLHYSDKTSAFALPIILRRIEGTKYNDITSVYGYSGPLANTKQPDRKSIAAFHQDLLHFFDENSVVSVFSRLHPLFPVQEEILDGIGNTLDMGATVAIDLNLPENEQRRQYARSLRTAINRLKRKGLAVKKAETQTEIEAFVKIYTETMKRVHASQIYFFDKDYFFHFLKTLPSTLYVAYYGDKIVSGSLFTDCDGIIQAHLNATCNDYLYLSPLKYILDQIRIYGIEKNRNYLHLGGGFGGNHDTLFEFKSRFSHLHFPFRIWRYVHDRETYNRLVYDKYRNGLPDSSFFPLYRLGLS
ncbi:MAG: GNAT family N-acetyltransferase [Candidatus Symbiothrix sp.]|jgi:hypothetical protein|nr:GNAT family N-acetyltransferase [Candidatus Symbiothrix sp.]